LNTQQAAASTAITRGKASSKVETEARLSIGTPDSLKKLLEVYHYSKEARNTT
jgi:hypothetical protein